MKPIRDLLKYYGSLRKTGAALGKGHNTVKRWADAGALIDQQGQVWIKTADTDYREGEKKMKIDEMQDGRSYGIGVIGNYYGGLNIRKVRDSYEWSIQDATDSEWSPIAESLVIELLKHEEDAPWLGEEK